MNDESNITPAEERALNELGTNFDALLARTPEPRRRRSPDRKFVLAAAAVIAALIVAGWAVFWPDSRLSVDDALAALSDVAAAQPTPGPKQFIETQSTTSTLVRSGPGETGPPGTPRGGFYTANTFQHAWRSRTLPGRVDTRTYAKGPDGTREEIYSGTTRPAPNYRIGRSIYTPAEIQEFAKDPSALMRRIDADARTAGPEFKNQTKWSYLVQALQAGTPPLPSSIRAELIREIESIPGVSEPEERRDPQGRTGFEFELIDHGLAYHALFDPKTSQLLYSESVFGQNNHEFLRGSKRGQVFQSYILISSEVADSVPKN